MHTKIAVFECGKLATIQYIRHCALFAEIKQKISKILLARDNYALVWEFGSLKDRRFIVIKEAR